MVLNLWTVVSQLLLGPAPLLPYGADLVLCFLIWAGLLQSLPHWAKFSLQCGIYHKLLNKCHLSLSPNGTILCKHL
jgi:hypothetical protein